MGVQISTVDEYLANNPQLKGRSGARGLVEVFINEWIKTGSAELAEDAMYVSPLLEQAFPGILDDQGVAVYTISQYTAQERNYNLSVYGSEDKNEIDQETSGKYMIKELCHHFEAKRSFTSMTLVRDTFGLYGGQS